ncbi:MAG: heavy metal-binding domain-containing protein [Planctomycetota bacterium]
MKNWIRMSLVAFLAGGFAPLAWAQHGHGEQGHDHGKPVEFKMPTTYSDAVSEIEHRLHEISELMSSKQLAKVHAEADVIQKVAKVIGQLALKEGSGVPKEAVKDVNLAGKDLAAKFDAIDKAGDSGDLAGTKKVYEEMVKIAETLAKYAPKTYQCPMKCEGQKTYNQPAKCPKCGMDVQDVKAHADHEAKHGGSFFMTSDNRHHLEGTLSTTHEFRIYFYDEYTKPIPADKFTADGKAWTQKSAVWMDGADQSKPFTMTVEPGKAFLTAKIDSAIKLPIGIKVMIDFKNGQKPQNFDFDFKEPSKEPAAEKK